MGKVIIYYTISIFLKYKKPMQKIINTNNLNKKALNKIKLFKKYKKKNFQFKEGDKVYL